MFTHVLRVLRTAELRTKIVLTLGLVLAFRVGAMLPAPGIDFSAIHGCLEATSHNSVLGVVNMFSGGALGQVSLFALGVMPYITASIIGQLLTAVVPKFARMKKEGGEEAARLTQWTRYLTLPLATVQAVALVLATRGTPSRLYPQCNATVNVNDHWSGQLVLGVSLVVGAMVVMWVGEQITERGIGNGASLLIFASIAAALPAQLLGLESARGGAQLALFSVALVLMLAAVVFVEQGQRRVPVRYAKTNAVGVAASYTPFKVNMAGVVPIIYASSMMYAPVLLANNTFNDTAFGNWVHTYLVSGTHPVYMGLYMLLVVFFTFFQVSTTHNPIEMAEQLANNGGYIPGVRPGVETEDHLGRIIGRLTTVGAAYLAVVALLPMVALGSLGNAASVPLGGTALLILVNVALETTKQFSAQARQYLPYDRSVFTPVRHLKEHR